MFARSAPSFHPVGRPIGSSRRLRPILETAALLAPAILVYVGAYVLPLAGLTLDSLVKQGEFSLGHYAELLTSPAFGTIILRTLTMAGVVTVLCLLIGYPLAYVLARLEGRVATGLLLLVSIPYVTSILIRTYAWIVVLSPNGLVNQTLISLGLIDTPLSLVFNKVGVYIGMVQVQLPLMVFPLYAAMRRIDRSLISAARNLGSSSASAFWHVFGPLSGPGIASGCTLVFLSCLGFYVTPALLGGPGEYMVAQGITVRVLTLADFAGAASQATLLLALVLIIFVFLRRRVAAELGGELSTAWSAKHGHGIDGLRRWPRDLELLQQAISPFLRMLGEALSYVGRPLLWIAAVLSLMFLVLPLLVVIPLAFSSGAYLSFPPPGFSFRWFAAFFDNRQWLEASWFSIQMAGGAAVLSLMLGVPVAFAIVRRRMVGRLSFYLLLISPLVVPQVVVAVALYFLLAPAQLVGTKLGFILAYTLLGLPYVVVLFIAGLRRFDRSLEMAAASLGAGPLTILRTVNLPLLLPTIASAFLFAFIVGFDDVVFGLFLSGAGATPLPIRMWDNIRLEISPQIAVVAVLLFAILAVCYAVYLAAGSITRSKRLTQGVSNR